MNTLVKQAADKYILSLEETPNPSFNGALVQALQLYVERTDGSLNELVVDACQKYLSVTYGGFNELIVDALRAWLTARSVTPVDGFNSLVRQAAYEYVNGV